MRGKGSWAKQGIGWSLILDTVGLEDLEVPGWRYQDDLDVVVPPPALEVPG